LCIVGQSPAAISASHFEQRVTSYLQPLLKTNNFSGIVAVAKGDQIILKKGYGYASIEHQVPNSPETVFQIASLSKPFTAAAILLLAERGKLDLQAPLTRVLRDYPNGAKLTIHHLLTHTSGIPNINDFDAYENIQRRPHTPAELVAYFKDRPLEFEPGARYSYSNSNYNLLALIIERVSGTDYGTFLRLAILNPLKIKRAGHHGSARQIIPGIADGYAPSGSVGLERAPYLDWSVKTGNGSLYSDAEGVIRFMRAVHQGHLLAPASVTASFTHHTPKVGYGWFLTDANGREVHHINGRSPGWAAQADYYVKDGVTVVVLANTYVSVTTEIARAVGALHFGEPVKPMPALSTDRLDPARAAALIGKYQFGPDYYVPNALISVRSANGHLEAMVGDYGPFAFVQISPTRFLIRSFWVPADFSLGADGEARELVIDGRKGVRIQ
jgi:CubicO group peptidase (beta-lactamase class C family)